MQFVIEHDWEWQEVLKQRGYSLIAPKEGCYRKKTDAEKIAREYKDSYVICHTYGGMAKGYMVYAKVND